MRWGRDEWFGSLMAVHFWWTRCFVCFGMRWCRDLEEVLRVVSVPFYYRDVAYVLELFWFNVRSGGG